MVTAKAEEADQLVGFAVGADDYVTKPYSPKVLIERIKRQLRHHQEREEPSRGDVIECQGVVIDRHRHRALLHNAELPADADGVPPAGDPAPSGRSGVHSP